MIGHVAFVTTEYPPASTGGAAAVVARLVERLEAAGGRATVILVADEDVADPSRPGLVVARPDPEVAAAGGAFQARSRAAAEALAGIGGAGPPDLVEFQDFDGLGFWALSHRHLLGLEEVALAVRMHGPVDLMVEAMGVGTAELEVAAAMERESFAMADLVIAPSQPMAALLGERYGIEEARLRIGPPPVPDPEPTASRPVSYPEFVAYGRLAEVKGSEDFLAAAVEVAEQRPDSRFRFVGPDGWSVAAGMPMSDRLRSLIPDRYADRFAIEGAVPRAEVSSRLASAWAVVIPSRFETFCLAAHEARRLGLPLVVADLPAFRGIFSPEVGAEVYDGSPADLAAVLGRLAGDPDRVAALAAAPPPPVGDPLAPYRDDPPRPRHPRSQAGLATGAVHRVAAVSAAARPQREPRSARPARALLRVLPGWAARLAVKVLPQGLKDRFRETADWRVEAERRTAARRRRAIAARIESGEFPELADPLVSVVIPCFDQGEYLEDALLSVFEQTLASFEIIVVDDGSTDPATVHLLDRLDWPRTRVVRQENRGLPAARNAGMRLARGRFLVPLDADDEIAPGFLEELHRALEAVPEAAYAHCWSELFGDQEATWVARPFNPYLLTRSNSVVGCVLLRRDAWAAVGGYDETLVEGNEDWDLWLRLLEAGWGQVQVRRALFRYRRHGVSMSTTTEARFEVARREVARRHPGLYEPDVLRRLKREWYPWVSVVAPPEAAAGLAGQTLADAELIPLGGPDPGLAETADRRGWSVREPVVDAGEGARRARGKFVVAWAASARAADSALAELADALEAVPAAAAAGVAGPAGAAVEPVLWRRWALVDPEAGHCEVIAVDVDATIPAEPALAPGCCPVPEWTTEGAPAHLPVMRPVPEGEGRLPTPADTG